MSIRSNSSIDISASKGSDRDERGFGSLTSTLNHIPKLDILRSSYPPLIGANTSNSKRMNTTVNGAVGGISNNNTVDATASDIADNVLVHGYVHGHIHKHKDHTHIHGHIHNHDHQHETKPANADCKELEASFCDGIVCDELDDCFFLDCNPDDENNYDLLHENDCFDPTCSVNHHENNLCDLQTSKRPLFETLISNVHRETEEERQLKKIKNERSIELHFPHICHTPREKASSVIKQEDQQQKQQEEPIQSQQLLSPLLLQQLQPQPIPQIEPITEPIPSLSHPETQPSHHHIHNSCFHTKIPNEEALNSMSDYEFFVQFNNFDTNFPFASNTKNITPATNLSDPPLFQCKWDSCINQVSDDTFMKHLLLSHIDKNENKFHCEWNNCNFELDNLDSLLEHVNSHKQDVPFPMMESIPTPVSFYEQSPVINTPSSSSVAGVNITSMKISPREPQYCPTTDESFTCKWQIGTNPSGEPITCDKTHSLAGELQDHIIDHIGLGKSVYNCEWVGCSRHNGKEFVQKQKLLRHIHIHTGHKPCKCHVCGACFAVDAMLRQHLRIHTGEKPFQCNICGKTFTTSSSLSIHNRVHTGEKPLECKWPGCGKRFSESSNYTKHLKVHMKSYHCEVCGEAFDKKPDYTKHLKLHKK